MNTPTKTHRQDAQEQGFVLVTLFTLMIPMLVVVVAFSSAMTSRSNELRIEFDQELALLACESGVDDAIYQGKIGGLTNGLTYTRDLGGGQTFTVETTYLKVDGLDNDGDLLFDEDDEDVYQVIVTGTYRQTTRRVAAYLGTMPVLPVMESAMATQDLGVILDLRGGSQIDGNNTNVDGTDGAGPDTFGLKIAPPGTVDYLDSQLTGGERSRVDGLGPSPSLGLGSSAIDLSTLVDQLKNSASMVLTSDEYSGLNFGDASADTPSSMVTYREGNLTISGNSRGAGILVVTGDLEMKGNFRFDGVIIVLGAINNSSGNATVYGSMVQGPAGGLILMKGTMDLYYSEQAIAVANSSAGNSVAFNGWQELSN